MNKLLIVVDMQNDFIDGSLGTPEAQAIVDNVCKKIDEFHNNKWDVIYTYDTHNENYLDTPEGKILPVKHCVYNTHGWKINDKVRESLNRRWAADFQKPTFACSQMVKRLSKHYNRTQYDEIILVGLCTDICVISNAMLLKNAFYDKFVTITVDASCCAGVTPEKHKAALEVMKSCQINVINE